MDKPQENALALRSSGSTAAASLQPFGARPHALTRQEQDIVEMFDREVMIVAASSALARRGMNHIAQIHEHAAGTFDETVGTIVALKAQPRSREHQLCIDEFTKHQIPMFAKHLFGVVDIGATRIAEEVSQSFNLPEEREGFWGRLFGR